MTFRTLALLSSFLGAVAAAGACTPVRAQPIDDVVAPQPTCNDGVVWHRSADITFCATTCTSDIDCASGERCRVLNEAQKPEDGALFADDMQEELLAAHAEVELAKMEPMFDEPPACEGECAPYTGDLQIRPSAPLALCDPFHDVAGAMLSAVDEEILATQTQADVD